MPIAKLEFKLPEEEKEFKDASNAQDMSIGISEFAEYLRREYKYEDLDDKQMELLNKIRKEYFDVFEKHLEYQWS